jgi:hypothetical protein
LTYAVPMMCVLYLFWCVSPVGWAQTIINTNFTEPSYGAGHVLNATSPATNNTPNGSTWSDVNGDWTYIAGGGIISGNSADLVYPAMINVGTANYTAKFTYPAGEVSSASPYLLLRYVDANDYVFAMPFSFGAIAISYKQAGASTQLAILWTDVPDAPFTVTMNGSTVTITDAENNYASGTIPSTALSTLLSSTEVGFFSPAAHFTMSGLVVNSLGGGTSTATTLSASSLTPMAGTNVTLTANVTPPTATGTVSFMEGSNMLGTGALSSSGVATYTVSSIVAGAHNYTAVYAGDANDAGSTSSAVTVTAQAISTTTSLSASSTNPNTGATVILTATVAPSAATGTVTFMDGSTTLSTETLSGGSATFAVSSSTAATHNYTAGYSGNSSYASSTSSPPPLTVIWSGGSGGSGSAVTTNGGSTGSIPLFAGSSDIENSVISQSSGRVGIGTTMPNYPLQVATGFSGYTLTPMQAWTPNTSGYGLTLSNYNDIGGIGYQFGVTNGGTTNSSLTLYDNGNVGVGLTAPQNVLSVVNGINVDQNDQNNGNNTFISYQSILGISFGDSSGEGVASARTEGSVNLYGLDFYTDFAKRLSIAQGGNVGIGTTNPGASLEVNGNVKLTANSGASITFPNGSVQSVAWNGVLSGGDYAESVDVTGDRTRYEPGDVLVIDESSEGNFLKSAQPYSTGVTGIYSTNPGVRGRRQLSDSSHMKDEVPMAMTGIVPTKVSAENGPIKPGDLLVTSSRPGYAMKGTDRSLMLGAVIGKALGHLDSGVGVIEVVVTLQ